MLKTLYKIVRFLLVLAILLVLVVPALIYVTVSLPGVQRKVCAIAQEELTQLLDMEVRIREVALAPFNRVTIRDVAIIDQQGDTAISARRIGAGINLYDLLTKRRMVVDYTELMGLNVRLKRDSIGAPLNIQPMIEALQPKDPNKDPTRFDLRINMVMLRQSRLSYDVVNQPTDTSRFDANHVGLRDIRADLQIPILKNDLFEVKLKRLALSEKSGFELHDLSGELRIVATGIDLDNIHLQFGESQLRLANLDGSWGTGESLREAWRSLPLHVELLPESYIHLNDLAPFVPALRSLDEIVDLALDVDGTADNLSINTLTLSTRHSGRISVKGTIDNLLDDNRQADLSLKAYATAADAAPYLANVKASPMVVSLTQNAETVDVEAKLKGSLKQGDISLLISTAVGSLQADIYYTKTNRQEMGVEGSAIIDEVNAAQLLASTSLASLGLGEVEAALSYNLQLSGNRKPRGYIALEAERIGYRNKTFNDISGRVDFQEPHYQLELSSANPDIDFEVIGEGLYEPHEKGLNLSMQCRDLNMGLVGVKGPLAKRNISFSLSADLQGPDPNHVAGHIDINNLYFKAKDDLQAVDLGNIELVATADSLSQHFNLKSEVATAQIDGTLDYATIGQEMQGLLSPIFPALVPPKAVEPDEEQCHNNVEIALQIITTQKLDQLVKMPLTVIHPVDINCSVNPEERELKLRLDAPYLQMGNKLIENTGLHLAINNENDSLGKAEMYFATILPTKNGDMTLATTAYATNDHLDTKLQWKVARERDFSGVVDLSTAFKRQEPDGGLLTELYFNRSQLVFNDTVWYIDPSLINIQDKHIEVNDLRIGRQEQYLSIRGTASANPSDTLTLRLQDVNLDYIFETLDIGNAMFGGQATGTFIATSLFTPSPTLYTPLLSVKHLSYNHSLMGDATIKSFWDQENQAVVLDARIDQPNECHSTIKGSIRPMAEELDFNFDADKIEIGFMRPFMEAFTSEVGGYASGKARLYGTFKLIDMVGDIYAQDVWLKLDFTNTYYWATDSVRLTPGHILLQDITLRDQYGNTALLNGWLTHECFKKPRFDFSITNAQNMLVYDVPETTEQRWYGRIFGNGSANIQGEPGLVNIGVNMSTAPNSTFTFVLTDAEEAYDYNFVTFRDRDQARKDSIDALTAPPQHIRELKERLAQHSDDGRGSIYKMNIAVDVNQSATVILVMDPIGGDRIRAHGSGNLRMTYDSSNEDLRMFGTYTLSQGSYNFTLQDIIIKDFTIRDGSSISFHGDPYAAQLDIQAVYSVNANLSDLDESFLDDKELNCTNVPVHALLMAKGDMLQPDISFDLEFPTLTQDTYRKVKSIVSTEEMMNRQIIYLLALNRFYTPDYMTATKGNELVSVASATVSSQLSNILGQLSDNWSIAPNFRSDRGDFSDVEVDLALSSHLLNNRLLFNGNFGYRDKAMNNNTFIGDFDIEYLLNRSGSVRLKAYNRYNDQNYYVKNALTTQGVGVVWKRDFDNIFSFLNLKRKKKDEDKTPTTPLPVDSLPSDTIRPEILITLPGDTIDIHPETNPSLTH